MLKAEQQRCKDLELKNSEFIGIITAKTEMMAKSVSELQEIKASEAVKTY